MHNLDRLPSTGDERYGAAAFCGLLLLLRSCTVVAARMRTTDRLFLCYSPGTLHFPTSLECTGRRLKPL